mmetsp:Transcript_9492/g.13251  ORF Transcript_9492/g.13251 Transcript_9492/m.13251 type:complete len:439 (+) Transcript_9492:257-1573(+)|eukprot:CAMPEP_0184490756 /NCGR_PEP_ID=MMETSP0113_2-20130426/18739_1 /TAXON_ID=91329 /ORGANISM="Norrisiella sphaerica, Strain BC52" /LENGTH=438 /DNA_ID=CAMNT_0026874797 /DNA_START=233 /DNA_END=1549 /DNA_ORIENTATION=+
MGVMGQGYRSKSFARAIYRPKMAVIVGLILGAVSGSPVTRAVIQGASATTRISGLSPSPDTHNPSLDLRQRIPRRRPLPALSPFFRASFKPRQFRLSPMGGELVRGESLETQKVTSVSAALQGGADSLRSEETLADNEDRTGEEEREEEYGDGDTWRMELHPMSIEGESIQIARPFGIDDHILEVAANGGDLEEYFWAFVWPAATALSTEFRKRPSLIRDKLVLEIGAGLGIAGITAAMEGAKKVTLLDNKVEALRCALTTAQVNDVRVDPSESVPGFGAEEIETDEQNPVASPSQGSVSAQAFDWNLMHIDSLNLPHKYDVIILGDVFHGTGVVKKLRQQVPLMLNPSGCIIIAGGSLDVAELNFVGAMTEMGFGLEEVQKRDVEREYDVQMEDPGGKMVHLVRLREGSNTSPSNQRLRDQLAEDDEDMDELDIEKL